MLSNIELGHMIHLQHAVEYAKKEQDGDTDYLIMDQIAWLCQSAPFIADIKKWLKKVGATEVIRLMDDEPVKMDRTTYLLVLAGYMNDENNLGYFANSMRKYFMS
jgi:hypothetical protein